MHNLIGYLFQAIQYTIQDSDCA